MKKEKVKKEKMKLDYLHPAMTVVPFNLCTVLCTSGLQDYDVDAEEEV